MNKPLVVYILASALVTYLPRALPFFISGLERLPEKLRRLLSLMPVAALGALIFPGVILDFSGHTLAGLAGVATAAIISFFTKSMIAAIVSSILVTFLASQFI